MNNDDFAKSLIALEWKKEELKDDVIDERAIHSLLTSVVLRNMGEMDKAKEHLQDVLNIDKFQLKGNLKDDWTGKPHPLQLPSTYPLDKPYTDT